jgi:hypothetical protein
MLRAHPPTSRKTILEALTSGIGRQEVNEEQERLLCQLSRAFLDDEDSEFEAGITQGDFGEWCVYGDIETALEELSASYSVRD